MEVTLLGGSSQDLEVVNNRPWSPIPEFVPLPSDLFVGLHPPNLTSTLKMDHFKGKISSKKP